LSYDLRRGVFSPRERAPRCFFSGDAFLKLGPLTITRLVTGDDKMIEVVVAT